MTDLALTGGTSSSGQPWESIPVAFSNGNGTFRVTNTAVVNFGVYATQGAQLVAADINGDGRTDLALTGGSTPIPVPGRLVPKSIPWTTMPVAFSNGDGSFSVTNDAVANFPTWATQDVLGETYSYGATEVSGSEAFTGFPLPPSK